MQSGRAAECRLAERKRKGYAMEREIDIFQMYLSELSEIAGCSREENARLAALAGSGDEAAAGRLVEGNLKYVLGISSEYIGRGLPAGDLVQEANIALMTAVKELDSMRDETFERFVEKRVRSMLDEALGQQEREKRAGEMMADRVNLLQDVSKDMADELGREPRLDELARRLEMTEEEIKDIMKMALDAVNVLEG